MVVIAFFHSGGLKADTPFEMVGAPWVSAEPFAAALNARGLPGVHFRPVVFEPTFQKHARTTCGGCQVHVLDRASFLPVLTGVAIIDELRAADPASFAWRPPPYEYEHDKQPIDILYGSDRLRATIDSGLDLAPLFAVWESDEEAFRARRREYLLY